MGGDLVRRLAVRIRDRDVRRILAAPVDLRHWRALRRMFSVYEQPGRALIRYLTNAGGYPWQPGLRTPSGVVRPVLTSYHDLLTVNEVFCRQDYGDGEGVDTVVDIGANVGLAALFFLTRSPGVRVWCCEPDPANLERTSGRGLFLIWAFMSQVAHSDGGRTITMVMRRRLPDKA